MLNWIRASYKKNRTVLFMCVMYSSLHIIDALVRHILDSIIFVSVDSDLPPGAHSCPYRFTDYDYFTRYTEFLWTEQEWTNLNKFQRYSQLFPTFLAGVYSDKYGGHRVVLVGFLLNALFTSAVYLTVFDNIYIFVGLFGLRKIAHGIAYVACFSLVGKLPSPHERTVFLSIVLSAEKLGNIVGISITAAVESWKTVCYLSACFSSVTALWWWMIYRSSRFPVVPTSKHIPWKKLMTSTSLYISCFIVIVCAFIAYISMHRLESYVEKVIFFNVHKDRRIISMLYTAAFSGCLVCGALTHLSTSTGLLSVPVVKKILYTTSSVVFSCILMVIVLARCDLMVVVACWVALHYINGVAYVIVYSVVLDVAPAFSGTVSGIVLVIAYSLYFPGNFWLESFFISGDSRADINSWRGLFITIAILVMLLSLPYLLCEMKPSWGNEMSCQYNRETLEMESTISENAEVVQNSLPQKALPGPSNKRK